MEPSLLSIIIPYWNRLEALKETIDRYHELYTGIEIITVDDGSGDDFPFTVRLPRKDHPLNPCVPINAGVKASHGDIIVLTNPEVFHLEPILNQMKESLKNRHDYVMAAVREPHKDKWLCHSLVNQRKSGFNAGFHFCTMMYKSFFYAINGFDERYRDGQGFDDNDFVMKLKIHGANFIMRDDLVAESRKVKRCHWPKGGLDRNKKLFRNKWKTTF